MIVSRGGAPESLEAVRPEPKVPNEKGRDEAGPAKFSDISDVRESGYLSVKTDSRTFITN